MNSGQRRGMIPEDITRIRWVSDVRLSPRTVNGRLSW